MAVTTTFTQDTRGRQRVGRGTEVRGRLTLSGTYATGGFAVTASGFGLSMIDSLYPSTPWETTEGYFAAWDSANSKIKLGWTGAVVSTELDEITNADDVTDVVLDVVVRGV